MTLIIATINKNFAILASDRRLTSNGNVVEEESTKTIFITTPNGRFAMGYTGLAKYGTFNTEDRILDVLERSGKYGTDFFKVINKFAEIASNEFCKKKFDEKEQILTVVFVGYLYDNKITPVIFRVSNYEYGGTEGKFKVKISYFEDETLIELAGYTSPSLQKSMQQDLTVVEQLYKKSLKLAAEIKLYDTIYNASQSPSSNNMIGERSLICSLDSQINTPLSSTYYAASIRHSVYSANFIVMGTSDTLTVFKGMRMQVSNNSVPTVVPRTGKNNLCTCGSGVKYKYCHGKISYPYMTLFSEVEFGWYWF